MPVLPRIFTGQKRKSMVSRTLDVLRDWRQSPFEHEGPARAGIRQALCLDGYDWPLADNEALALVEEGLRLIGAKRPTWIQGQPEYTIAKERCAQCNGPLDEQSIANHERFCSSECRRVMRTWRNANFHYQMAAQARLAYDLARKAGIPQRDCAYCGVRFKPRVATARTCSPEHAAKLRAIETGRAIPDRTCRNPACGKVFHPQFRRVQYCSTACHRDHQAAMIGERQCANPACGKPFQARFAFEKFCGGKCRREAEKGRRLAPVACAHCGEPFEPREAKNRFCGRSCASKARSAKASAFRCDETFLEAAE